MNNIIFKQQLFIEDRKRDRLGHVISNALNKDLKIEKGDILCALFEPNLVTGGYSPYINVINLRNQLSKENILTNTFIIMMNDAFDFKELM